MSGFDRHTIDRSRLTDSTLPVMIPPWLQLGLILTAAENKAVFHLMLRLIQRLVQQWLIRHNT